MQPSPPSSQDEKDVYTYWNELDFVSDGTKQPKEILDQLFTLLSPFLPIHVLENDERKERIRRICSLIEMHSKEVKSKLIQLGETEVAPVLSSLAPSTTTLSLINEKSAILMSEFLLSTQPEYTSELLDCMGFLSKGDFDRTKVAQLRRETQDKNLSAGMEYAMPLSDLFPAWFPRDLAHRLEVVARDMILPKKRHSKDVANATIQKKRVTAIPHYRRLHDWMLTSLKSFNAIKHGVPQTHEELLKEVSSEDRLQSMQISDIDTFELIELLKIILNPDLQPRYRYEAFIKLYLSISEFSLTNNPVFQARQETRNRLSLLLGAQIFKGPPDPQPAAIPNEVITTVSREEVTKSTKLKLNARKVSENVRKCLDTPFVVDPTHVTYASRTKDAKSTTRKMLLAHMLYKKCEAILNGKITDLDPTKYTLEKATAKISEFKARRRFNTGTSPAECDRKFSLKPISFDSIDDALGFSFGVNLTKPINAYESFEVEGINSVFSSFAEQIASGLGLSNVSFENHLWAQNSANGGSSSDFRVFKIHGEVTVVKEVYNADGNRVQILLKVPVEVQIFPLETELRLHGDGPTGKVAYKQGQNKSLLEFVAPKPLFARRLSAHQHQSKKLSTPTLSE